MKKKYQNVLKENWIWSGIAFLIPFGVSVIICGCLGIYPFGENCILHIDMYHQYCPFFMEFREKLTEGGSLLYSWNLGLGADFIGTYAYYLASPFNWLLIFCPKGLVIEFMTLTTWIRFGLAGLFFFWFLGERFGLKDLEGNYRLKTVLPALVFSTAYAFSGYMATYSWNIMWLDAIILTPLIVMGLERLVKKNQPALYYGTLAAAILSNYYISILICIFLVLYFGILLFEQKQGKIKACMRFAWYSLLAGGSGAILLIPEALLLGNTASSNSSFPQKMTWYFGLVEELSRLCTTASPYTGVDHWPNLYCGAFSMVLVVLYTFNKGIRLQQKLPRLLLLGFFLISFSNNVLNYIWHGFHFPNSLPARQSFLFIFMLLIMGYEAYRKRKGNKLWQAAAALILWIGILVWGSQKVEAEIVDSMSFLLTGVFLVAYFLCFCLEKIGSKQMGMTIKGFAFGLAMGEIILNMAVTGFYALNRTAYLQKMEDYEVLLELAEIDALKEAELGTKTFYRVEDTERKTKNDDSLYGYPSGTLFSSLTHLEISHFYQSVFMEGGKNFYCYNGATPLLSSMLSVKYMLSDNPEGENDLREIVASSNGYYLYENKYCLPLGFMMSEEAVKSWDNSSTAAAEKIKQINGLAHALGANGNMLLHVNAAMSVEAGTTAITVPDDGIYYAHYDSCNADSLSISINGGAVTRYSKTTHRYLLELGQCQAGDEVLITNGKESYVAFQLYKLNPHMLDLAYHKLNKQIMVTQEYTDTYISGRIEVTEPGRLILSIPSESGWTLYVDGKETEIMDFKDTFISVYLENGFHKIELKYMTPGLTMGAVISGCCIGLFALTMGLRKRKVRG